MEHYQNTQKQIAVLCVEYNFLKSTVKDSSYLGNTLFLDMVIISAWATVGHSKLAIGGEIGLNSEGCDDFLGREPDLHVVFDGVHVPVHRMCAYASVGHYNRKWGILDGVGRNTSRLGLILKFLLIIFFYRKTYNIQWLPFLAPMHFDGVRSELLACILQQKC